MGTRQGWFNRTQTENEGKSNHIFHSFRLGAVVEIRAPELLGAIAHPRSRPVVHALADS